VAYVPHLDSVFFCYNTGDTSARFQKVDRCNQAAVYDLVNDTWSFVDLPNVSMITMANADNVLSYASCDATRTYDKLGSSYYDQENTYLKSAVAVSSAFPGLITNSRLLGYDFMSKGWLAYPYVAECNAPPVLERIGIALDQLGSDLTTYKKIRRLYPLVTLYDPVPITFQLGYSNTPSEAVKWGPPISFDPAKSYKIDTVTGGRYLAVRITMTQPADFDVAGWDCDVVEGGRR
jgi:hypothetical protein